MDSGRHYLSFPLQLISIVFSYSLLEFAVKKEVNFSEIKKEGNRSLKFLRSERNFSILFYKNDM